MSKTPEELMESAKKTIVLRQKIAAIIAGQEMEPAYSALVELLSELLLQSSSSIFLLGNTVILLTSYMQNHGAFGLDAVDIVPAPTEEEKDAERTEPLN